MNGYETIVEITVTNLKDMKILKLLAVLVLVSESLFIFQPKPTIYNKKCFLHPLKNSCERPGGSSQMKIDNRLLN